MPATVSVFRRGGESIIIARHKFTNCTMLVMTGRDGTSVPRSFCNIEDAIVYQQHVEGALTASGWLLDELIVPEQPSPEVRAPAFG